MKAGGQRMAAETGMVIVCPGEFSYVTNFTSFYKCFQKDTSPRGVKVEGDDESWDFGTGSVFEIFVFKLIGSIRRGILC